MNFSHWGSLRHVLHFERIVVCKQAASLQSPLTMIRRPFFNSKIKLFVGHKIYKVLCPFETVPGLQYCGIWMYLEYQRVHCHTTPRFRKIWIMYDHVTFSVGAQPSWVASLSNEVRPSTVSGRTAWRAPFSTRQNCEQSQSRWQSRCQVAVKSLSFLNCLLLHGLKSYSYMYFEEKTNWVHGG